MNPSVQSSSSPARSPSSSPFALRRWLFGIGLGVGLCLAASARLAADAFQNGNLVVLQVGDGSASLNSAATAVSLLEYSTSGVLQQTLNLPSQSGTARLTQAGSSTSEGYISLSADGTSLSVVGYDAVAGTVGIASTTASLRNRVIDSVSATGDIVRFAGSASLLSGQNIRSGVISGSDAWAVGSSGGAIVMTGSTPGSIYNGITSLRVANVSNGNLTFSTQSGTTTRGIYQFSGLPTATATPSQIITTDSTSAPVDFSFSPDATLAYIADERASGGGGVQKWVNSGGTWSLSYTLSAGSGRGARGLAVDFSGLNPTVFATTTQNELIKIVDTGSSAAPTILATAGANVAYRGLEFVTIPEPGETAAMTGVGLLALAAAHRRWKRANQRD